MKSISSILTTTRPITSSTCTLESQSLQTLFTPFQALKRFTTLSEWFYPQHITFNRTTGEATPTKKSKLIPWYFLSFLGIEMLSSYFYVLLREVFSLHKDPDISVTMYVILIILSNAYSLSTTIFFMYHTNAEEFCFLINNAWKTKGI